MSTKDELLLDYSNSVKNLINLSRINKNELEAIYFHSIQQLELENNQQQCGVIRKRCIFHFRNLACLILAAFVFYHAKPLIKCGMCSLQEYIYPGLRILRTISIPVISAFPGLTDLYDETCLMQNVLFRAVNMECWPCSSVASVAQVEKQEVVSREHCRPPFIYRTNHPKVDIKMLERLYADNDYTFIKDASKVNMNNEKVITASEMFQKINNREAYDKHFVWRINRIAPDQLLRTLFRRPTIIPQRGLSIEKFILIDFNNTEYKLPDTECNFTFIHQVLGNRMLELIPSKECLSQCQPLKVLLKESHLLWYNWWYWRPVTKSSNNETLIAHMGSYC